MNQVHDLQINHDLQIKHDLQINHDLQIKHDFQINQKNYKYILLPTIYLSNFLINFNHL